MNQNEHTARLIRLGIQTKSSHLEFKKEKENKLRLCKDVEILGICKLD